MAGKGQITATNIKPVIISTIIIQSRLARGTGIDTPVLHHIIRSRCVCVEPDPGGGVCAASFVELVDGRSCTDDDRVSTSLDTCGTDRRTMRIVGPADIR